MKETGKVIRWVVVGAGGTTLISRASMPNGALSRQHLPEQPLKSVNDGLRHSTISQLQEANPAALSNSGLSSRARVNETYSKLPLSFEANSGQTDSRVKFLSRGRGYTLFQSRLKVCSLLRVFAKDSFYSTHKGAGPQQPSIHARMSFMRSSGVTGEHPPWRNSCSASRTSLASSARRRSAIR